MTQHQIPNVDTALLAALKRLLAVVKEERSIACKMPIMADGPDGVITLMQCAGGAEYAAEDAIEQAEEMHGITQ